MMTAELNKSEQETPVGAALNLNVEDVVQADIVEISQGGANQIQAQEVTIRQGGANSVQADVVQIRQGGVVKVEADKMEVSQGGVVFASTQHAHLAASNAMLITARGNVNIEQGGLQVLVTQGDVQQEQCGTVLQISKSVTMDNNSSTVFLFAKNVDGEVHTQFGQRESILFGVLAGISAGIVLLSGVLFKKKR
jgi:hypothetical protein